jgi:signal peptidase II
MKTAILRRRIGLLLAVVPAILALDQFTKLMVERHFHLYESINVIGTFFRISFIYNLGSGFGLSPHKLVPFISPVVFFCTLQLLAATVVVVLFFRTKPEEGWMRLALALITGGALGNVIDRIRIGKVIDFIDWGIGDRWRWFVFNVADSSVTVGISLIILITWFGGRKKREDF